MSLRSSELTKRLERSERAAVAAALALADSRRADRAVHQYAELPNGFLLVELARRRAVVAWKAADYARQCEREFIDELMHGARATA